MSVVYGHFGPSRLLQGKKSETLAIACPRTSILRDAKATSTLFKVVADRVVISLDLLSVSMCTAESCDEKKKTVLVSMSLRTMISEVGDYVLYILVKNDIIAPIW